MSPGLMTVREMAIWLKVSTDTVYALGAADKLPSVRVGSSIRFVPEDVQAAIQGSSKEAV